MIPKTKTLAKLLRAEEILSSKLPLSTVINRISIDSQQVQADELFVAISGTKIDSHDFVQSVLDKGAAAVVVDRKEIYDRFQKTILVSSSRQSLGGIASRFYEDPSLHFRLVGITGTNGKTTCTFLLENIWKAMKLRTGLVGTVECHLPGEVRKASHTTPPPLVLQELFADMVEKHAEFVTMEVTSIAIDQFRTWGSQFEVAVFTNLTQDHLDYHGTFENYFEAKLKLFRDYKIKHAVVNVDDSWGRKLVSEISVPVLKTSLSDHNADFYAREVKYGPQGSVAPIVTPSGDFTLRTPLIGSYYIANCLSVLATISAMGLDVAQAVKILEHAPGAPGRLERVTEGAAFPSVFVDYAHTPDALLKVLRELYVLKEQGRLIVVFGCGGDRDREKRPQMGAIASQWSDVAVITSDNPRTEDPEAILNEIEAGMIREKSKFHREVDRKAAIHWALDHARKEDLVIIAGKGHETYQTIGTTQIPFDDARVIRDYYRN